MTSVATVLVDEPALDREFSYLLPDELLPDAWRPIDAVVPTSTIVPIGTIVRVKLRQRRMRGWITRIQTEAEYAKSAAKSAAANTAAASTTSASIALGITTSADTAARQFSLESITSVVGFGPPPHVVELTKWAASRWAGTRVHFMRAASPERVVRQLPSPYDPASTTPPATPPGASRAMPTGASRIGPGGSSLDSYLSGDFIANPPNVIQLSPADDWFPIAKQACELGRALILTPSLRAAHRLTDLLRRQSISVALSPNQFPDQWLEATAAQVVVGARGAAWAPIGRLDAVVVFDEHDQVYQSEAAPTWHARTVAMQRALVDGARCFLISPVPSPDAINFGRVASRAAIASQPQTASQAQTDSQSQTAPASQIETTSSQPLQLPLNQPQSAQPQSAQSQPAQSQPAQSQPAQSQPAQSQPAQSQPAQSQSDQSQPAQPQPAQPQPAWPQPAWPHIEIVDRRGDDPMAGEWCSDRLARVVTDACAAVDAVSINDQSGLTGRVVCVLNRKGRARLSICRECGELARSEATGVALKLDGDQLIDPDSGEARPVVCANCGSLKFRRARLGVKGVAAELEALTRRPVVQVTSDNPQPTDNQVGLYIGTEAALHRIQSADIVAFLDFDQELAAPRYRAAEEAMALLVLAARMVGSSGRAADGGVSGGRVIGGKVVVQTRQPSHPVLRAATSGDLLGWSEDLLESRRALRQPPCESWALISGAAAKEYVSRLEDFRSSDESVPDGSVPDESVPDELVPGELEIASTSDGIWRVRSRQPGQLHAALSGVARPKGRLRVAIDPVRA